MATFLDRHPLAALPAAVRYQIYLEAVHGLRDPSGALPIGHWVEDGFIYCIVEAPDETAVCRHHSARQMGCAEIHPLSGLRGSRPLTGDEMAAVRAAIVDTWHDD